MTLDLSLLLCFAWGGIVYADTEAACQTMISQPLVCCTVAGWILGNVGIGLTTGILLQLPFLAEVPAGGTKISGSSMGSLVAAILAVRFSEVSTFSMSVMALSLVLGIIISWLVTPLRIWTHRLNSYFAKQAEMAAMAGRLDRLSSFNYLGVANAILLGFVFSTVFFILGSYLMNVSLMFWPPILDRAFHYTRPMLLGAGIGAVVTIFIKKRSLPFTVAGIVLAGLIIWVLPI